MKPHYQDTRSIMPYLYSLVRSNKYEKILVKIPSRDEAAYKEHGYVQEAVIPEYFNDGERAVGLKYCSSARIQWSAENTILPSNMVRTT